MYFFTLLLFPLAFVYYVVPRLSELRSRLPVSLFSFCVSCFICAFRFFFMFRAPCNEAEFAYFFVVSVLTYIVFPLFVYLCFLLFSRDSWRMKIESFCLFMLPFYAMFLPCEIFADTSSLAGFYLFVKPVLYLVMVVSVGCELRTLFFVARGKGVAVALSTVVILVEMSVPPLVEVLWHFSFSCALWSSVAVGYVLICAFRSKIVFKLRKELQP